MKEVISLKHVAVNVGKLML